MSFVAWLPGLAAAGALAFWPVERVFLSVYLPTLLLLPDYQRWILPGIPDLTYTQSVMAVLTVAALPDIVRRWRFGPVDAAVALFAASVAYSQFINAGFKEAQNLIFDMLLSVFMPYVLGKGMLGRGRLGTEFSERVVALLCAVALLSVWQFRMGHNPWISLFSPLFPDQPSGWFIQMRWGFARVSGPFGHAILCAMLMAAGWLLEERLRMSDPKRPGWRRWVLILGMLMTFSRGPWIGAAVGWTALWVGRQKRRLAAMGLVALMLLGVALPGALVARSYLSADRLRAATQAQGSAVYRKELMEKYLETVTEKMWFGWGRAAFPEVEGMPSVDNQWLLLALEHGAAALGGFLSVFILLGAGLVREGVRTEDPERARWCFAFAGILAMFVVSISTVYLGLQARQTLFMLAGWAEAYLRSPAQAAPAGPLRAPAPMFARVLT